MPSSGLSSQLGHLDSRLGRSRQARSVERLIPVARLTSERLAALASCRSALSRARPECMT